MDKREQELVRKILNGDSPSIKEIAIVFGVSVNTIKSRIKRGWPLGNACVTKPVDRSEAGRRGKDNSPWAKEKRMLP
jgi:transposase